jgi:hypothetical protein
LQQQAGHGVEGNVNLLIESALNASAAHQRHQEQLTMPSLFRFLFVVAVLAGLGYVVIFSLAHFVDLKPREISVTVPQDKFLKR